MEEMLIRANHFTRVFKRQMNNFLKASIAFDGWGLSSHVRESEIPLTIEIQNPESRIPVPLTAKTAISYLEYGIHSVESRVQELS